MDTAITIKEYVKHTLTPSDNIPFIDLVICPNFFAAYKVDALKYYGLEKGKYRSKGQYYPTINGNDTDPREIFYEVSHDVEEIFVGIRIKTLNKEKRYVDIDFSQGNFNDHLSITTKFWNTFGRCYSIIPKENVLNLGVNNMEIKTRVDIYVYFGHPGQFLAANRNSKVIHSTFYLI